MSLSPEYVYRTMLATPRPADNFSTLWPYIQIHLGRADTSMFITPKALRPITFFREITIPGFEGG